MKKNLPILLIAALFFYFFIYKKKEMPASPPPRPMNASLISAETTTTLQNPSNAIAQTANEPQVRPIVQKQVPLSKGASAAAPKSSKRALPYVLEDGLVVVQGDWVVGYPVKDDADENGMVEVPGVRLWPSPIIPVHFDSSLKDPDRVKQALAMFDSTAIQFVPFTNQKDALVFIDGNGTCKSYVGKIGGHQPVWLPAGCGPKEIAHELMHALGFVHEQNRSDRDNFIQVHYENIDEKFKDNFEKLPAEFMKASGFGNFDFESIMIYPVWMFAKNGRSTMQAKSGGDQILPSPTLSKSDIERINKIYGARAPSPESNQ